MSDAFETRTRRSRRGWHRDDAAAVSRAGARKGHHRRQLPHSLAGAVPFPRRDGGLGGLSRSAARFANVTGRRDSRNLLQLWYLKVLDPVVALLRPPAILESVFPLPGSKSWQ